MGIALFVKKELLLMETNAFLFVELIKFGTEIHAFAIPSLFELNQLAPYVALTLSQIKLKNNVYAILVLYGVLFH